MKPQIKKSPKQEEKIKPSSTRKEHIRKDKNIREKLKEKQVDKMIDSSFPASDPPSTY